MIKSFNSLCIAVLLLLCLFMLTTSLDCDSCGLDCKLICGTKRFRNCCYNYIRKRSRSVTKSLETDPHTTHSVPSFKNFVPVRTASYDSTIRRRRWNMKK